MSPQALTLTHGTVDLGTGEVHLPEGRGQRLTTLESALLAYLAARPGVDVDRDELIREVWRDAASHRVVDTAIGRLRRKLGESHRPRHLITSHGFGYRFVPAETEPAPPPPPLLDPAVPLATGRLHLGLRTFQGLDGPPVALTALDARILDVLVAAAGRPVARDALARAVWGVGRHELALRAAIGRLRVRLGDDPADPRVLLTPKGLGVRLVQAPDRRGRPPEVGTSFVPRPDLGRLLDAVERHALVTVFGAAGIGKTRLARALGDERLHTHATSEVWFCELARIGTVDGLVAGVSTLLGGERTTDVGQVGRALAGRPDGTLLVLDNVEQLVEAGAAAVVAAWARAVDGAVRIVATSRIPLGAPGEHVLEVAPLDVASGCALFAARAPPEADTSDADAVRDVVTQLDGLPLAIELAAAVADRVPPATLRARLGARLDLLVALPPSATSHHSTLRGAIDWSWHLLDEPLREVLAACAVFEGPFDAAAVSAVVGRPVGDDLGALVARSLVRATAGGLALFESVRAYAHERLKLSGAERPTVERHAQHFAAIGQGIRADIAGRWSAEAIARLRAAWADLCAAVARTEDPHRRGELALAIALGRYIEVAAVVRDPLLRALDRGVAPAQTPYLWVFVANCSWLAHEPDRAASELARAAPFRSADPELDRLCAIAQAALAITRGEAAVALGYLEALDRDLAHAPPSADRLRHRAEVAALRTAVHVRLLEPRALEGAVTVALPLVEELGDPRLIAMVLRNAARRASMDGDYDEALVWCRRAVAAARGAGRPRDVFMAHFVLTETLCSRGHFRALEHELAVLEELGSTYAWDTSDHARALQAQIAMERGDFAAAHALFRGERLEDVNPLRRRWQRRLHARVWLGLRRADDALATLAGAVLDDDRILVALAHAIGGNPDEADAVLREIRVEGSDPRLLALVGAILAVERARGRPEEPAVRAHAQSVLAAGRMLRGDDGVDRERPSSVAVTRTLLEAALAWQAPATRRSPTP